MELQQPPLCGSVCLSVSLIKFRDSFQQTTKPHKYFASSSRPGNRSRKKILTPTKTLTFRTCLPVQSKHFDVEVIFFFSLGNLPPPVQICSALLYSALLYCVVVACGGEWRYWAAFQRLHRSLNGARFYVSSVATQRWMEVMHKPSRLIDKKMNVSNPEWLPTGYIVH